MLSFLSSWVLLSLSFPRTANLEDLHYLAHCKCVCRIRKGKESLELCLLLIVSPFGISVITLSLRLCGCHLTSPKGTLPEFILSRSSIQFFLQNSSWSCLPNLSFIVHTIDILWCGYISNLGVTYDSSQIQHFRIFCQLLLIPTPLGPLTLSPSSSSILSIPTGLVFLDFLFHQVEDERTNLSPLTELICLPKRCVGECSQQFEHTRTT